MKASLVALSLTLVASSARADQCQWIDDQVAGKAEAILAKQPKVIDYCEPCGDKAPGEPVQAKAVARVGPELKINGKAVDLAYTYVQTSATKYHNLALLAGCAAQDVSPSLTVADETKRGVLITASTDPVPQARTVIATVPIALPVPAAKEPSTVYIYSNERMPFFAIVIACAGGFVIGAGFSLTALALRRRRPMRPRATDL